MKLENEHGFAVQTPPRKSYNPFDSDDENTDGFVESNINTYDIKSFEENTDSLTFHLDIGDISWEEVILGHSPIPSPAIPADANVEEGNLFRKKETELFTDKTVMECELPELMVCYKENSYHSVKDIGIDEGVPVHEELKCTEDSVKGSGLDSGNLERQHNSNHCGTDDSFKLEELRHDLSKKESDSRLQDTLDETRSGIVVNAMRDHRLSEIDELNHIEVDKSANGVSREGHGIDCVSVEHVEESSTKPSIMNSKEAILESSESKRGEATSPQSLELPVSQESGGSVVANALSYNSKVESGSIVLNFNSSSTILVKEEKEEKEKSQQNMEAEKPLDFQTTPTEKPPRTQTMSRHDNEALGADKRVHGETSFSAEMPPPASIIYLGPNARCGSISLRSESSTGSTRSFAFPVLQAEWNSSPVRMEKAEQRHLRKHRGWVHSLMCCRF